MPAIYTAYNTAAQWYTGASNVATSGALTWTEWNGLYTTSSSASTDYIWGEWVNAQGVGVTVTQEYGLNQSQAQAYGQARNAVWNRLNDQYEAEIREKAKQTTLKLQAANARAERLLAEHLDIWQREMLYQQGYFELELHKPKGVVKRYRIHKQWAGGVKLLGADGEVDRSYCIHAGELVPVADNMLAQMLMLRHEEERFLKIANETVIRRAA